MLATVPAWWSRRARLVGLAEEWRDWKRALVAPPVALPPREPDALAQLSSHSLGERYVCALSQEARLTYGRHYTPKALAEALWREIDRSGIALSSGAIVDPASGAGSLLLPPLRRFVAARRSAPAGAAIAAAADGFAGVDNDPLAAWLASAVLAAELLPLWVRVPESERKPLPALVVEGDGLEADPGSASVVVMNPPYGRAALDEVSRKRWAASLYGHANWYGVFLHAAVERVAHGGLVAGVLPASFLGGAYYQRLRRFLNVHAPLVRLRLIDDRSGVFASGVLQETCLAVFRKGAAPSGVTCSTQAVNGHVRSVNLGRTILVTDAPDLPWLLPRSRADRALVRAAGTYPSRLRDFGWKATTGPLVWNRHKPQISREQGHERLPILWAADVEMGRVARNAARDHQRWITLRERDHFMRLDAPAVLVQRTTAPEQARRLVGATLTADALRADWRGAVVVENHVNVLRCSQPDSALSPELLTALLNSPTYDRLYRCMTGTVAVSAYELEALPLPARDVLRQWSELDAEERIAAVARAFA